MKSKKLLQFVNIILISVLLFQQTRLIVPVVYAMDNGISVNDSIQKQGFQSPEDNTNDESKKMEEAVEGSDDKSDSNHEMEAVEGSDSDGDEDELVNDNIVIIQFNCYGVCAEVDHIVYDSPSENANQLSEFNHIYMNDAQFIEETETYFKVYFGGLEGWVKKLDVRDNTVLTAEPRVIGEVEIQNNSDNNIVVNAFEVNELLEDTDKNVQSYSVNLNDLETLFMETQTPKMVLNPTIYRIYNGDLQVCYTTSADVIDAPRYCISLNKAPDYLEEGQKYYSYDGIYFYSHLSSLSIDGETAINKSTPNYNYFQYLPIRTVSKYKTADFISYLNNHSKKYIQSFTQTDKNEIGYLTNNNKIVYNMVNGKQKCTYNNGAWTSINGGNCVSSNRSMLFNSIESYKNYEETRGVNGLIEFAWAIHESGHGRSAISIFKNNFFGMAAYDSCASDCATAFSSPADGIRTHIDEYVYRYSHPLDWRYYGSHLGDSVSGMNVKYASDQQWGAKIASILYNIDKSLGSKDYNYYTLGIVENSKNLNITDSPSSSGILLYNAQSGDNAWTTNYPVIIVGESGNYYKIKTDVPVKLNYKSYSKVEDRLYSKRELAVEYDWQSKENITYGYIPKSYVTAINNPSIKYRDPVDVTDVYKITKYEEFISRFYQIILQREPDSSGLNYWVNNLLTNNVSAGDLVRHFVLGDEFKSKNFTDSEFVDIMYRLLLNRDPDSNGKQYWLEKLEKGLTRDYLIVSMVNSGEYKSFCEKYGVSYKMLYFNNIIDNNEKITEFVNNFYIKGLERKADVDGLKYWVENLVYKKLTGLDFTSHVFLSKEMINLDLSNEEFIKRLYRTILMREPDEEGMRYWSQKLYDGVNRSDLIKTVTQSTEYINLCKNLGIYSN